MDTGLTIRPMGSVAFTSSAQPDPALARQTVATELAPSQSVTATAETTKPRNDTVRAAPTEPPVAHDIHVDPATHNLVYSVVNVLSGQVISQVPDPASLQMAAYTQAIERGEQKGETPIVAEAKADLNVQV